MRALFRSWPSRRCRRSGCPGTRERGTRPTCMSISSRGRGMRSRLPVLVRSITSPLASDRRTKSTPSSQRMSGVGPVRRSGRSSDGMRPVASPSASMAKCCGYSSRALAMKRGTSSTVSEFGCSSVYVCHVDVSSGLIPLVGSYSRSRSTSARRSVVSRMRSQRSPPPTTRLHAALRLPLRHRS